MTTKTTHTVTKGQVRTALSALRHHYDEAYQQMKRQRPETQEPEPTKAEQAAIRRIQRYQARIAEERKLFRPYLDVDMHTGRVSYKYADKRQAETRFYRDLQDRRVAATKVFNDLRLELESAGVYALPEAELRAKLAQAMAYLTQLREVGEQPVPVVPTYNADEAED